MPTAILNLVKSSSSDGRDSVKPEKINNSLLGYEHCVTIKTFQVILNNCHGLLELFET